MTTAKRLAWNRFSGQPFPTTAKLIGRGTRYGNPFRVSRYGRPEALRLHHLWLLGGPPAVTQAHADGWRADWPHGAELVALIRSELAGRDVVCTGCDLDEDCHGDLVLTVAAGTDP